MLKFFNSDWSSVVDGHISKQMWSNISGRFHQDIAKSWENFVFDGNAPVSKSGWYKFAILQTRRLKKITNSVLNWINRTTSTVCRTGGGPGSRLERYFANGVVQAAHPVEKRTSPQESGKTYFHNGKDITGPGKVADEISTSATESKKMR